MNKIKCNVIKDLLPLYIENVVSDDTRILVEEHLSGCEECKEELQRIQSPIELVADTDASAFKSIKKMWNRKKLLISVTTALIMVLVFSLGIFLYQLELPVENSETQIWTEEMTIQGGLKVFQVNVKGHNIEMDEVSSDFNDKSGATLHYKIVRTTFLRNIFTPGDRTVSVGIPEYWNKIDGFESILLIEFADKTVTYKNGKLME